MIPLLDLKAQYRAIQPELDAAVSSVLSSGHFILGPEVTGFEQEFAAYCQTHDSIAVNSGTSALHLALLAAGVGPGDEVITVPFTFAATAASILYTGATPVYVDIDPVSFTMDAAQIESAITARTKAIIPVHLYGQPADMDPIMEIAARRNLIVIEDSAQAHGAEYRGRRVGSIGHMGCFSFYPGKNLGGCGEGGAVTTNNTEYAKTIRLLRSWAEERKYHHVMRGYNYRMDALQAAILRVKLRHLDAWTESRRSRAALYRKLLEGIATPVEMPYARHVYCVFTVRTPQRSQLQQHLQSSGIQTAIHYPVPLHHQPAYHVDATFPHAEHAAREVLSLPLFPEMTDQQVEQVSGAVLEFARLTPSASH